MRQEIIEKKSRYCNRNLERLFLYLKDIHAYLLHILKLRILIFMIFFRLSTYVNQAEPKTAFCVQMELFSVKKNSPANGGTK